MISSQECRDKLQRKRENPKVYQKQKKKCEREIDGWIRHNCTHEYIHVYLKLSPHPKLVSELEEAGYVIKIDEVPVVPTPYILSISLPQDVENTSLQDESGNVKEPAQEEGFLSKLKSFCKR